VVDLFIKKMRATRDQDVGNNGLPPHKARVLERNKVVSCYNPRGLDKLFLGSSWGRLYQIESLGHEKRFGT
jgi:hypothetical protein